MSAKTYLVTGAAGFIGARFAENCQARGISTIAVDQKAHFEKRHEIPELQFSQVVDRDSLFQWLSKNTQDRAQLDAIFHLGAITNTQEQNLERLKQLNLEYSKALWNYASLHKIPYFYASSAATYGDGANGYDDDESTFSKLKPLNAYGVSKLHFDIWALEQEKKGIHPPAWAGFKFFNVYGFGERHKAFMSSVVLHSFDEIRKSGQTTLFKSHRPGIADGHQKRDFILVEDVIKVLHFAVEKPIQRGIYNLGTGQARTFIDLARAVFSSLKKPENIQFIETPLAFRDKYQYFTEAKMDRLRALGYSSPFTSLEDGVDHYIKRLLS